MTFLLVALGAAVGASMRFALSHVLDGRWHRGTLLANVAGSGLFGLFAAISLGDVAWAVAATGFCGAFTTFSSFAVQTIQAPPRRAALYATATAVLAVVACAAGWWVGSGGA